MADKKSSSKDPFSYEQKFLKSFSAFERYNYQYQSLLKQISTPPVMASLHDAWSMPEPAPAVFGIVSSVGKSLEITDTRVIEIASGLSKITSDFDLAMKVYQPTSAWFSLQKSIRAGALTTGLKEFSETINKPIVESQNMALLKLNSDICDSIKDKFAKGTLSSINQMHIGTAKRLANTSSFNFLKENRTFFVEDSPSNAATIQEMNIVCSGADVLLDISEVELVNFLSTLTNSLTFASSDPVGVKIFNLVSAWRPTIGFDCNQYYHARTFEIGTAPYPADEMCAAPSGITWHGRFNWPGKSHYYFSDQNKGALYEMEKHATKPCRIQIASIKPIKEIKLIDLSGENKGNKFLEHCRFPMSSGKHNIRERAYLLPCYVSDCCARLGLDGIKYYGSKKYSNYVTWTDGHFSFVSQEICDIK